MTKVTTQTKIVRKSKFKKKLIMKLRLKNKESYNNN